MAHTINTVALLANNGEKLGRWNENNLNQKSTTHRLFRAGPQRARDRKRTIYYVEVTNVRMVITERTNVKQLKIINVITRSVKELLFKRGTLKKLRTSEDGRSNCG